MSIYIVGGFMRTGTSAMMRCLEAGGLEVVHHRVDNPHPDDYDPNPHGYYESKINFQPADKFLEEYENKCFKALRFVYRVLPLNPNTGYNVVVMLRDPEEIAMSLKRWKEPETISSEEIHKLQNTISSAWMRRIDTNVAPIPYKLLIEQPLKVFQALQQCGWEIDPEKAAAMVEPELYRNKK